MYKWIKYDENIDLENMRLYAVFSKYLGYSFKKYINNEELCLHGFYEVVENTLKPFYADYYMKINPVPDEDLLTHKEISYLYEE